MLQYNIGNASIASKIKEISDVGRTAAQLHSEKSSAMSAPAPAAVVASLNASGTSIASMNALKKRRIESAASIATTANACRGEEGSQHLSFSLCMRLKKPHFDKRDAGGRI